MQLGEMAHYEENKWNDNLSEVMYARKHDKIFFWLSLKKRNSHAVISLTSENIL